MITDSDTKKNVSNEKYKKIIKRKHAFKCFASSYKAVILNSFNPEP